MNNAELRSHLTYLGLSLRQLSTLEGWDYRELRRQANGMVALTRRTVAKIEELEERAGRDLEQMLETVSRGDAVVIPRFSSEGAVLGADEPASMPGSYWHAGAGRARSELGEKSSAMTILYAEDQPES